MYIQNRMAGCYFPAGIKIADVAPPVRLCRMDAGLLPAVVRRIVKCL